MRYEAVIFDLDGTLINSIDDLADSCNSMLIAYDLPTHEVEAYKYFVGNGIGKLVERALPPEKAADKDFYEDNDETLWKDLNCWYDKEEDDWIVVGESFKEFRASLNPMRSIDHAGEVAEYMLILTLNDLGKAFLKIDEFVSNVQPYNSVRPKERTKRYEY